MIYSVPNKQYDNGAYPQPLDDINPEKKTGAWIAEHGKYYYSQYLAGNCGITKEDVARLEENRLYLAGKQPTDQYKEVLTYEANKGSAQSTLAQRKAFHNINYNSVSSPMPKFARKIEGMFLKQDHEVCAKATNEKARSDKETLAIEKFVALKLADVTEKLQMLMEMGQAGGSMAAQPKSFLERDVEEIQILANAGTFKLGYEVAAEKAIDATIKASNYKHIKRKVVRDLLSWNVAGIREVITNNKVNLEYIDLANAIIPHLQNTGYDNPEYFCYQKIYTIKQLRQLDIFDNNGVSAALKEEQLKNIAMTFHNYNHPTSEGLAFDFYCTYYDSDHSFGYDDYKIPVLYVSFVSVNTEYSYKFKVAGEERITKGKWGITKDNTLVNSEEMIYHGNWIMGTDYHFGCGLLNDIPRNSNGKVRIPAHIVKLDGTSIMDNAKPILDQYALLGYRLQNAWATAVPSGYAYDWSVLEEAAKASGGKLTEFDIVKQHAHAGRYFYRSRPQDSNYNVPMGEPIKRFDGGIGWTVLQEFLTQEQALDKKLVDVTGIPTVETAGERTSPNLMRMAIASMSDVLKPLYDGYIEVKENACYNAVYRIQILVKYSDAAREYYSGVLGRNYVQFLIEAFDKEPMAFGITFEAQANEDIKMAFLDAARQALAPGKNSIPLLRLSDYAYLVENINTNSGIKTFRMLLQHREILDEQIAQQRQAAMIESQGKAVQEQIALKEGLQFAESMGKGKLELDKIKTEKDLAVRNDLIIQGQQQQADFISGIVMQTLASYQQGQQGRQAMGGQDAMQPAPPVPQPMQQQ